MATAFVGTTAGIAPADGLKTIAESEAEPQPGDITLETGSEESQASYYDVKVADRYGDVPFWEYAIGGVGMGLSHEIWNNVHNYDEVSVQGEPGGDWLKTRSTPEQFTTAQILRQQETLVSDSFNDPGSVNVLENINALGGPIEPATTSDQAGGGGILGWLSDLFGGGGDWWKGLLIIGIVIVGLMLVVAMVS